VATVKDNLRQRVTRRVVNAAGGGMVDDLLARIEQLEDEVQENRNLNLKLAELIDVVQELLIPVASQDKERLEAALLMAAALQWATDAGAAGVWLGVNQQNERAQRFYAKSGFERVGTKQFLVGGVLEDDFVMERTLTPAPRP
jgi:hypothetical protein